MNKQLKIDLKNDLEKLIQTSSYIINKGIKEYRLYYNYEVLRVSKNIPVYRFNFYMVDKFGNMVDVTSLLENVTKALKLKGMKYIEKKDKFNMYVLRYIQGNDLTYSDLGFFVTDFIYNELNMTESMLQVRSIQQYL